MISDDEIASLPDDPELAFIQYERIVRKSMEAQRDETYDAELSYITHILAFVQEHEIDIGVDPDLPVADPRSYFMNFSNKVNTYIARTRIRKLRGTPGNYVTMIVLDADYREEIHKQLSLVRKIITAAELSTPRREALFARLNAFAKEVDKVRTTTEALTAMWLDATQAIGEGAENLDPALKVIERIAKLLGRAKAENETGQLPPAEERPLLEGPATGGPL